MAFMQKTFVAPSGSWRETHHVKRLGSEAKGNVLLPRRVEPDGLICVSLGLGHEALMIKYPRFKWNEKRSTRVDITPGPAMQKKIEEEGECSVREVQ